MNTIYELVDLTLLREDATPEDLAKLTVDASQLHVAAICVYPEHLSHMPLNLNRATVLNFPSGHQPHTQVLEELSSLLSQHLAEEIDYVFPYTDYLSGRAHEALKMCQDIYQQCIHHNRKLKIILETGALPSVEVIHQLSLELIQQGCHFLKTSTGKIATGATLEAASAILSAIQASGKPCGIKISGGIRTKEQAMDYIHLAEKMLARPVDPSWFRIGTSGFKD